jgi:hypothetical protein
MDTKEQKKWNMLLTTYLDAKAASDASKKVVNNAKGVMLEFLAKHGEEHPEKPDTDDRAITASGYKVQWCQKRTLDDAKIIKWASAHRVKTVRAIVNMKPTLDKAKFKALRELGKVPKKVLDAAQKDSYSLLVKAVKDKK